MMSQNYSKTELAEKIKSEYDFNEYEVSKEKLKEITEVFCTIIGKYGIKPSIINDFFVDLHIGKLGMLYKAPSDMVSKFFKYCDDKRQKLAY